MPRRRSARGIFVKRQRSLPTEAAYLRGLLNKEQFGKSAPVFATFQTFTDTGIPRRVIRSNADTLIHASVFCCGRARAFMVLPKMRL